MKRKLALCLLLALVLIAVMIPATVLAAPESGKADEEQVVVNPDVIVVSGSCGPNLTWTLADTGVLRITGTGAMTEFSSPSNTAWKNYLSSVEKVVIEYGVTTIGQYALQGCTNMMSVSIPETVTSIGREALLGCTALTEITIPRSVTSIKTRAFADCTNLYEIIFDGLAPTFEDGYSTFRNVEAAVYYPPVRTSWTSNVRGQYGGNLNWVEDNNKCGDGLSWFITENGYGRCLVISGTGAIWDYPSEYPGWYYFRDEFEAVIFSGGIMTGIGDYAFYDCPNITYMQLRDGLETIGRYAFWKCSGLTEIRIPGSVIDIGECAFEYCGNLESIRFCGKAPVIDTSSFNSVTATAYYPPLQSWTADVRQNYGGTLVWVPYNKCGENATWAISSSGVLTISGTGDIWDYPEDYPEWYYAREEWSTLKINSGITGIGEYAFYECYSLESVTMPNTLKTIGDSAFEDCDALTGIAIPNSVTTIKTYAFWGCDNLAAVTMGTGLKTIGDYAFEFCTALTEITIGPAVTDIEHFAFYGCTALKTVTIPVSVKNIGEGAFYNCNALTEVNYGGDPTDWAKISIDEYNECLTGATIHYTYKPLTAPTNVKAVADTATTMKVSWDAVPGATKYVVYRKEGSADWKAFTNTTATSITLKTNLKHGYNYRFRIYAKNPQYTSAGSAIVLLKFIPPTPTGLTISSTGVGQATIKWDAIPNIKGYCVYYKRADDSGYTYAGATTATSKTITGLTTGARYAFKIRAYVPATAGIYQGQNIFSEYCKYVSGEIVPAAPTGLKIASTAAGKATITWNKVSGAYAYCIYYKRADDAGYTYFGATTATSKTITGLTTGKRYAFKIRAYCKPTTGPKAGQNVFGPYCKYVSGEIKAN